MEYKDFRVFIEDESHIRIIKPSGVSRPGTVQMDRLTERMINIFNQWLASGTIKTREELVVFGSYLFKTLFDDKVSEEFKDEFDKVQKQPSTGLRLVLEFEQAASKLANMPWEYLYYPDTDREKGFFVATRSRLVLARQVPLSIEETPKPSEKPLRILIVVSQPEGWSTVKADPVVNTIEGLKRALPGVIETSVLHQPTKHSLAEAINAHRPHILHFIGHGQYNKGGYLLLVKENDLKTPLLISDVDLAECFVDYQPHLIFLQACEGAHTESYEAFRGIALQLVYSKVPAVVAMQYPIENSTAIRFAEKFYQSLGEGDPIDVAAQKGRLELAMYLNEEMSFSSRAFGSPVVYLQTMEARGIILAEKKPVAPSVSPPSVIETLCPYPDCSGKVRSDDVICLTCRRALMPCPNCKAIMPKDIGICRKCGYTVSGVKEAPRTARPSFQHTIPPPGYGL